MPTVLVTDTGPPCDTASNALPVPLLLQQGRPRVLMSNATVTLFVDFNGSPMRLELMPVFQFPWSFLPDELKESRNLKLHQAKASLTTRGEHQVKLTAK